MTDTQIHGIEVSADGRRNMFSAWCPVLGQTMNYAACLWRLGALDAKDVRTPADWEPCRQAKSCGKCSATTMREEELLKGHSIYFVERAPQRTVLTRPLRKTEVEPVLTKPRTTDKSPGGVVDRLSELPTYTDAINAAASKAFEPVAASTPPVLTPPTNPAPVVALPNETPLQMARRLAAAMANKSI